MSTLNQRIPRRRSWQVPSYPIVFSVVIVREPRVLRGAFGKEGVNMKEIPIPGQVGKDNLSIMSEIRTCVVEVINFILWLVLFYSVWVLSGMANFAFLGLERSDAYAGIVFLAIALSILQKNRER
jgi:hypothetical protein